MFQILAYIKFIFIAKSKLRTKSLFINEVLNESLLNKELFPLYTTLKKYRHKLYQNHQTIQVTDFGSGSRVFKSNTRKISAIARNAGLAPKRAVLLSKLANYFKPKHSLEIGTSLGLGTAALHLGYPKGKITTLEGCPETGNIAQQQFTNFNFKNIDLVIGEFNKYLNDIDSSSIYDLVYFDGNHQKEATLNYFNKLIKHSNSNSVFIFDDIHWSKEMEEAWDVIKKDTRVKTTIDTFFWGLVFFNSEDTHQKHFKIRL
ncbi:O-methyltransferase [Pseudofulvibacter geojedonensis]|uniref:O-methyltransferase n=1 Tax=Pseudofulvibacter geojedonensis TaxID=1123758 RepID=A0ABW3HZF1_9FLAO